MTHQEPGHELDSTFCLISTLDYAEDIDGESVQFSFTQFM